MTFTQQWLGVVENISSVGVIYFQGFATSSVWLSLARFESAEISRTDYGQSREKGDIASECSLEVTDCLFTQLDENINFSHPHSTTSRAHTFSIRERFE